MSKLIGCFLFVLLIDACISVKQPPKRCFKDVNTEDCYVYSYKYYADMEEGKCIKYTSNGCGLEHKENSFSNWMTCMNTCFNFPLKPKYDWWDILD